MSEKFKMFKHLSIIYICITAVILLGSFGISQAAFNPEINYQAKLTDNNNLAVPDGTYNVQFKLYATSTGGTALWTENATDTDKIQVTSGLFSYLLGSTSSLSSVDFNQDLWLGVNIGSTTTDPVWDGEMTPRKKLGAVPAAFEAGKLDGYTWAEPGAIGAATSNTGAFTTLSASTSTDS